MSVVELAITKVKKLSTPEARELLKWLDTRHTNGAALKRRTQGKQRTAAAHRRMKALKAWEDSVRLTTNWEPPRLPDEFVKPFRL